MLIKTQSYLLEIQVKAAGIGDAGTYSDLSERLKTTKCYNVLAKLIINSIVSKDALKHIKNLQNTFDRKINLKEIYIGSENADVQPY